MSPLFALGFFDSILVMMFLMFATVVAGVVLLGKAAASPGSRAQNLAGRAGKAVAGKAVEAALGQVFKRRF